MAIHDFDKLKEISVSDVLEKLDIQVIRGRKALCFMHDDHKPSLTIYKDSNSWFCYTCNKGGNVIDLVEEYFHYDTDKACKWLEVEFNIAPKPVGWKWSKKERITTSKNIDAGKIDVDSEILEWVIQNTALTEKAHRFLDGERKIKKEIYESLSIRALDNAADFTQRLLGAFGAKRLLANHILDEGKYGYRLTWDVPCLLFPFYDITGKLVNIQSRFLDPITGDYPPRFRFVRESKTSMFNAPLLKNLPEGAALLVTEGVTDTLAALTFGINAVAVPGASAFKDEYVDLLCDYTIFMCPDKDPAGKGLLKDMKEKMNRRLAVVRELTLADGSKDIGAYYAKHEEIRFGE